MRRLFIISVQTSTTQADLAIRQFLANYRSHHALSANSWLVASGGTADALCEQIQEVCGEQTVVLVAPLGAGTAWSKNESPLSSWIPRQIAATSNRHNPTARDKENP